MNNNYSNININYPNMNNNNPNMNLNYPNMNNNYPNMNTNNPNMNLNYPNMNTINPNMILNYPNMNTNNPNMNLNYPNMNTNNPNMNLNYLNMNTNNPNMNLNYPNMNTNNPNMNLDYPNMNTNNPNMNTNYPNMNNNDPNMNNNNDINELNNVNMLQSMLEDGENDNINNWYVPQQNYQENNLPLLPNSLTNFQNFDLGNPNLTLDSSLPTTHFENDLGFQSLGPLGINSSDHTSSDGSLMISDDVNISLDKLPPSNVTGESSGVRKGKGGKKRKRNGAPAKNLMAERRRRKKLNARLMSLRNIVPKITKLDRASIISDAIAYVNELTNQINDLNLELESIPSSSLALPAAPPTTANEVHQLTQTANAGPSSIEQTGFQEPAKIEVRQREDGVVNIHMFCDWKPGLLYSIMCGLDNLGIEIQQGIISSFNGFGLDVFRAKKCNENLDIDQIKAVLLESIESQNAV